MIFDLLFFIQLTVTAALVKNISLALRNDTCKITGLLYQWHVFHVAYFKIYTLKFILSIFILKEIHSYSIQSKSVYYLRSSHRSLTEISHTLKSSAFYCVTLWNRVCILKQHQVVKTFHIDDKSPVTSLVPAGDFCFLSF